ncbi:unnamed protein product [Prorocentrum cordatum]|uniref:Cellulase n=1 Tax=Prorocentrum cordatum TaxID=2364126 RepID=A0ABN9UZR1_9DINO|nr:unnamed protein product [Polarella glacialis]
MMLRKGYMLTRMNVPWTKDVMLAKSACASTAPQQMKLAMTGYFGRDDPTVKSDNVNAALQKTIKSTLGCGGIMADGGWKTTLRAVPTGQAFEGGPCPNGKRCRAFADKAYAKLRAES